MVQKTTFIQKLYGLLSDSSHQHLITWSSSGTSFLILNAPQFSNQILPKTFKHNNYTSFVRQLNLYGFHKKNRSYHRGEEESRDTEPREFCHPRFLRGRTDLLCEIKRKGTGATSSSVTTDELDAATTLARVAHGTPQPRPSISSWSNNSGGQWSASHDRTSSTPQPYSSRTHSQHDRSISPKSEWIPPILPPPVTYHQHSRYEPSHGLYQQHEVHRELTSLRAMVENQNRIIQSLTHRLEDQERLLASFQAQLSQQQQRHAQERQVQQSRQSPASSRRSPSPLDHVLNSSSPSARFHPYPRSHSSHSTASLKPISSKNAMQTSLPPYENLVSFLGVARSPYASPPGEGFAEEKGSGERQASATKTASNSKKLTEEDRERLTLPVPEGFHLRS